MKHRKGPRHDGSLIHGVCAACGRVGRIDPETLLCLDCLRDPVTYPVMHHDADGNLLEVEIYHD
jgi:hypothetical protein